MINLIVELESYEPQDASRFQESLDLASGSGQWCVLVGFGNGNYEEARVVGHSKAAALMFIRLIQCGGYDQANPNDVREKILYQSGDGCFPVDAPFIFVSPQAKNGETIDFSDLESEIQRMFKAHEGEIEAAMSAANADPAKRWPYPEENTPAPPLACSPHHFGKPSVPWFNFIFLTTVLIMLGYMWYKVIAHRP